MKHGYTADPAPSAHVVLNCQHVDRGMCQGCTFEWMRRELDRLNVENASLKGELVLARARSATEAQRAAEVAGEDVADVLETVLRKDPRE